MNAYLTEEERALFAKAKIGIAGAGGLGSNCAAHLVRAGLTKFVICDFDVVSESNLNRQFFFRDQLGKPKVEALAENLRRINPELELELHATRLTADTIADVFSSCDIVVEAFDTAEAKTMFLSAMMKTGKPLVTASGLAGWGRSDLITLRRLGSRLIAIGDGETATDSVPPQSPRVGIAAAKEANAVISLLLHLAP